MSPQFLQFLQIPRFQSFIHCFLITLSIALHLIGDKRFEKVNPLQTQPQTSSNQSFQVEQKENKVKDSVKWGTKSSKSTKSIVSTAAMDDTFDFDFPEISDTCNTMVLSNKDRVFNYTDEAVMNLDSILSNQTKVIQADAAVIREIFDLVSDYDKQKDSVKLTVGVYEDRRLRNLCQLVSELHQISASPEFHYLLVPYLSLSGKFSSSDSSNHLQSISQTVYNTVLILQTMRETCTKTLQILNRLQIQFSLFRSNMDTTIQIETNETEEEPGFKDSTESLEHKRGHTIYRFCNHGIDIFTKILADCKQTFAIYTAGKSD
jgi:hypothetical protein